MGVKRFFVKNKRKIKVSALKYKSYEYENKEIRNIDYIINIYNWFINIICIFNEGLYTRADAHCLLLVWNTLNYAYTENIEYILKKIMKTKWDISSSDLDDGDYGLEHQLKV